MLRHFALSRIAARRLFREEGGVAAIEFAFVAAPFFMLIFVIMESGLNFFAAARLDDALRHTSREIQTGIAHEKRLGRDEFRERLCGRLAGFMDCSKVSFDVRPVKNLQLEAHMRRSEDGLAGDLRLIRLDSPLNIYCLGQPGDFMMARAVFELPNMFGFAISRQVTTSRGEVHIVEASRVFRNEPFKVDGQVKC
jgi:hypothetical protein